MLKQFSRMERTRNWLIVTFAILMGISLVLFYAPGRNQVNANPATNTAVLARVNREEITVADLYREKERQQQAFGGQFSLAQVGFTDKVMLNRIVNGKIIAQEATRLSLSASDAEVSQLVRTQFVDESGKFIGKDKYKARVSPSYGSAERYEQKLREEIAERKLRAFVTAGVSVSEDEVRDDFKRRNTVFNLTYVTVAADKLAARLQPSDEELQKYYEENKTSFRYMVPQKKIRYLFINQTKAGEKLNIPDTELRAAYDALKPEQKQAGVRVQQIVLKVARKDLDQQVLAKATKLAQDARGGADSTVANTSEEKFAEAAKGNSEDPATATKGGWLPAPVRRDPNRKNDILQSTLDMQEGQVSDPVFTNGAYYVFRRGASVPKTFEEAKRELLVSQRNTRAYKAAAQIAERAEQRLKETKDFQKVAQELAAEANMSAGEMVKETPFVKPGDDVPDIGSSPQFEEAVAPLENANDIGSRVLIKDGFAVPMLVEKREARIPDFAEVKDEVTKRVKQARALSQLEQTARELANNNGSVADLKAAAEKLGLEVKTSEDYKLGSPLEGAGTSAAADDAIYNLKEGEVSKSPVKLGESWVVLAATKRIEADLEQFARQRDQLTQTLLTTRRDDVFGDYITAMRARLDREGKVKIYEDVLARSAQEEESAAPPFGAFPGGQQ
ncbi:MAG TPA: peptidyl-prolyl cis-trans isomerase [Pyrinomonadaceae bacterium]|jgi:peptidyl-prolyl cis-trans isomerase D|nr:peptidyl-prolyl cis-trans isomerase [Pyrinomonadaceae bacterium]